MSYQEILQTILDLIQEDETISHKIISELGISESEFETFIEEVDISEIMGRL